MFGFLYFGLRFILDLVFTFGVLNLFRFFNSEYCVKYLDFRSLGFGFWVYSRVSVRVNVRVMVKF